MPDAFDAAKNETDQARKGLLQAIAQGGTAARQAYEAQQAQLQAQRASAVEQLARDSGVIGAPEAQLAELRRRVGQTYDTQIGALGNAAASRSADMAQRQAAGESYLSQVDAAIPVLRAQGDRQRAQLQAEAEEKARDRELRTMLSEMQLARAGLDFDTAAERASASRATAAAKAAGTARGDDLSDSELRTRLLGAAQLRTEAAPVQPKNLSVFGVKLPQLGQTSIARNAGIDAGITPSRVAGVLQPKSTAARKPTQAAHRADVVSRVQRHASPSTSKAFIDIVGLTKTLPEAISALDSSTDKELREDYGSGISRDVLKRWMTDYFGA